MLGTLGAALAKDLRLLARDRVGLVFLTIAPIIVITVAGFSLASLYGAGTRGENAYVLPIADEDGGRVGHALRDRLAAVDVLQVRDVHDRAAATDMVRRKEAGVALVIPAGASRQLAAGESPNLELLTDPVKYLEVASVRAVIQELRHGLERNARERAARRVERLRERLVATRADFERASSSLGSELDALAARMATAKADLQRQIDAAEATAERDIRAGAREAAEKQVVVLSTRLATELAPLRAFVRDLEVARTSFNDWLKAVRRQAGRYADRLPPPPAPPTIPFAVSELARLDTDTLVRRLASGIPKPDIPVKLPHLTPTSPELPRFSVPVPPTPPEVRLPGTLEIVETSVTGAPRRLNTFDQNVPGFSVTFLLLGMLLGVSLGLLDERDWGTLARLRTMPVPLDVTLVAKLLARFAVGVLQMVVLLLVGRLLFGISLGPHPPALLLPTAGIVFAGTAFGLVVAGLARSREAVLPLGSIVIVTMAAVGGCWWPIDLEPRWMQHVALAFPTTWAMAAYNDLMIRRQTYEAALRPTAVLFMHGLAYLIVGLALFRRRAVTAR